MDSYLIPIATAIFIFPFLALIFTFPYILYQYYKYGSIPLLRTVIIYSFILYLLTIYFLVILPLPPIDKVANLTTPTTQLIPFNFVSEFIKNTSFVITNPNTYIKALKEPYFYNVFFNIIMTIPFGIYLRYYFCCSKKKVIILSFLLSLFFELTQLSGLYGIYPRPYRLFDIDDLLVNTLGGFLGALITPLIYKILPTKKRLDEISYEKGDRVTLTRRFVAFTLDWMTIGIINLIFFGILNLNHILLPTIENRYRDIIIYIITIFFYFIIIPIITKGKTFGKMLVKIKIVNQEDESAKWYQYLIRYSILYLIIFPAPISSVIILSLFFKTSIFLYPFLIILLLTIITLFIRFYFGIFISLFTGRKILFYETWSNTKHKNTIVKKIKESTSQN